MSTTSLSLTNTKTSIRASNLGDYVKNLNPPTIDKLYSKSSSCCLAIFGQLPPLAKQYVIRLLFVDQGIPKDVISSWVSQSSMQEHLESVKLLSDLRIWSESPIHGGLPGFKLNNTFKNNLQVALLGGGDPWVIKPCDDKDKHGRDVAFLDQYAMERWECILHFMVGSQGNNESISNDTVKTLVHAGLIKYDSPAQDKLPAITADGFQFLLMDTKSQVWYFLLQYLDTVESKGLDLVECLTFLFQISFLTLGKDYSTICLSESMSNFLQHLREFGLIYQRKRKDGRFYPTKLVINLTSASNSRTDSRREGFIIVETNYRVFAYTNSSLQMALVALFTEMQYRLPNVGLGLLNRDSVRQALKNGITAEQIINFLRAHAHPKMKKIPPTVVDQIRLWEIERDRFIFKEGFLYSQFLSQGDFSLLRNYANDAGNLIWDNPSKRVMVVSVAGHEDVRRFWKRHKKDH
ncbi:general transcription factor IIH subunit 4 [Tetranychus urticae]|uniref:General transcription factor IIH subunit 4 n=1 Tax=Tetranychus urticae TaxID=32264 RepID=T1KSU7_TETUR|nr:general transcription factor IIH subunit 4 [Tetranychus urticae]